MALTDNIQAYWKFNESSGNAADSTANGNTLTNTNSATYGAGKIANAVQLARSSSQYMKITDGSQTGLDFSDAMSIAGWWKFTTLTVGATPRYALVTKAEAASQQSYAFILSTDSPQNISLSCWANGSTRTLLKLSGTTSLTTGTYYHLAVTKTGTTVKYYVNGSDVGLGTVVTNTNGNIFNSTTDFIVGAGGDIGTANKMDGQVDELGVWNRELTASEITQLYNSGAGLTYPFGEGASVSINRSFNLLGVGQ